MHHTLYFISSLATLPNAFADRCAHTAPKVRFLTKLYHPNIDKLGRICLDILKGMILVLTLFLFAPLYSDQLTCTDKWSPALQIRTVLLSVQALLSAPNPDDPLANDVAELWKANEAQAIKTGIPNSLFVSYPHVTHLSSYLIVFGFYQPRNGPKRMRNRLSRRLTLLCFVCWLFGDAIVGLDSPHPIPSPHPLPIFSTDY
jgi:hypothetical protein